MEHVYIKPRTLAKWKGRTLTFSEQARVSLTDDYKDAVDLLEKQAEWEVFYNCHRCHSAHNGQTPYGILKITLNFQPKMSIPVLSDTKFHYVNYKK